MLVSRIAKHEPNQHGGSLLSAICIPGFLMLGFIYFLIQVASYGLNFWAPQLIRSAGTQSPVMVGRIKDLTGSTTPALYVIGLCALLAAALLLWGLPQKLRTLDKG